MLVSSTILAHQGLTEFIEYFSVKGWLFSSMAGFLIVMVRSAVGKARGSAPPEPRETIGVKRGWRSIVERFTSQLMQRYTTTGTA